MSPLAEGQWRRLDDRVSSGSPFRCGAVPADRAAGQTGAAAGIAAGGRPVAYRARGHRADHDQPQHRLQGLSRAGARGPGEQPPRGGHVCAAHPGHGVAHDASGTTREPAALAEWRLCGGIRWRRRARPLPVHRARGPARGPETGGASMSDAREVSSLETSALETTNLSKRYGRTVALQDCTLALPAGRVAALVGPNGAGKTTLLQLCAGLLEPSAGDVRVFGQSPRQQTAETLPRLGFLAQDHPLYKDVTAGDLLTMGRRLNPRWDDELARARMQTLGIPLDRRMGTLSGGQQAQV